MSPVRAVLAQVGQSEARGHTEMPLPCSYEQLGAAHHCVAWRRVIAFIFTLLKPHTGLAPMLPFGIDCCPSQPAVAPAAVNMPAGMPRPQTWLGAEGGAFARRILSQRPCRTLFIKRHVCVGLFIDATRCHHLVISQMCLAGTVDASPWLLSGELLSAQSFP